MFKEKLSFWVCFITFLLCSSHVSANVESHKLSVVELKLRDKLYDAITYRRSHNINKFLDDLSLDYQHSHNHPIYKLEAIYQSYHDEDYSKVSSLAESFRLAYPHEAHHDYVSYMQALSLYKAYIGGFDKKIQLTMNLGVRDVDSLQQAKSLLTKLLKEHKTSAYYADAVVLHKQIVDNLLEYDLSIARSYRYRGVFVASQDRLIDVLRACYDKNMAIEVLKLMEANYLSMKLDAFAHLIKRVYLLN